MTTHSLIVGGTRGTGRALVRAFASDHDVVSIIGRRPPPEADHQVPNTRYSLIDVSDQEKLSSGLAEIVSKNGKLNNLVFLQRYRGEEDSWKGELDVSLTATKNAIEALADSFDDAGHASIVMVSSIADHVVVDGQDVGYHVAKAGLDQMMRFYAVSLAPRRIRVNCVSTGTLVKEESRDYYMNNKELQELYGKIIPLGRMATSEDIVNAIAFLCSPQASYITGQNIVVDGGLGLKGQESMARGLVG